MVALASLTAVAEAQTCATEDKTLPMGQYLQFITHAPSSSKTAQDREYVIWRLSAPDEVKLKGLAAADFFIEPENQRRCGRKKNRKCGLGTFDLYVFRVNSCTMNIIVQWDCRSDGNDCSHNQPKRAGGLIKMWPDTGKLAGPRRVRRQSSGLYRQEWAAVGQPRSAGFEWQSGPVERGFCMHRGRGIGFSSGSGATQAWKPLKFRFAKSPHWRVHPGAAKGNAGATVRQLRLTIDVRRDCSCIVRANWRLPSC